LRRKGRCIYLTGQPFYRRETKRKGLLQPLANNGGLTLTQSLGGGSPAIDAGDSCPPPPNDQRGVSRPQGSASATSARSSIRPENA
jgi:hypothetical protein